MFPTKYELNAGSNDGAEAGHDTEIKIACRCIMIGSYCFRPKSKVRISSEEISIPAFPLSSQTDEITIQIPLKSIVHVLAHTEHAQIILLYTEAKIGERVREMLGMQGGTGPYFDPQSPEEPMKRLALLPVALSRRHAGALRTLFGMVLDELDERDQRVLATLETEARTLSDPEFPPPANGEDQTTDQPERDDASTKNDDDKDSVSSSSSSVIFPPSPRPISVSSHSSVCSQKSSHSSRKRKNRHKKNKPNKKMKYVLVKNPEPHHVDAFLAGVAPILKGLNPVFLNLAKSEIISAALKYERRMLTDNCNGGT